MRRRFTKEEEKDLRQRLGKDDFFPRLARLCVYEAIGFYLVFGGIKGCDYAKQGAECDLQPHETEALISDFSPFCYFSTFHGRQIGHWIYNNKD